MADKNKATIRQLPAFLPTRDFIKKEESLRLTAYLCPAGFKTIGWGHVLETRDGLKLGDAITEERALQLLDADVIKAYQALFRLVRIPLTDNQQTALVSFIFNFGDGRFQASTLRQKLNRKEYEDAAQEFEKWVYMRHPTKGMIKSKGLISRRRREKAIFLAEGHQNMSLKPHPGILPFKYRKPRSFAPKPSALQKVAGVCMGLFKVGQ